MNDSNESTRKPRPYWHLDMKWIVALIFIPVFALSFLAANLYIMTERDNAVKVSAVILKAMYAPKDSSGEIEKVREAIKNSPDKVLEPFPGTDIKITEADLDKYTPEELKQNLFYQLAGTIYDGSSSSQGMTLKEIAKNLGLMALFTKSGHDQIGNILIYPILVSALLLALLILTTLLSANIFCGILFFKTSEFWLKNILSKNFSFSKIIFSKSKSLYSASSIEILVILSGFKNFVFESLSET